MNRIKTFENFRSESMSEDIFNELSLNSRCVKELVDHSDSCISTEKIWRS